jgi:surfeit locus 1 family protein
MRPSRKTLIAVFLTLAGAALFGRLGFWQLGRLAERRAYNAHLEDRLAARPVPVTMLPSDSGAGHYRRITARGVFDFSAQVALAPRSRWGSPGVHVLTPLRLASDTIVMVNRGWVYSPDARTIDLARWREHEGDTVVVVGYAETWTGMATNEARKPGATTGAAARTVRVLDSARVAGMVGAPILRYYLVQTSDSATSASVPVRLGEPSLDEGSHRNYAIQWFSFTLIAIIGGSLLVRQGIVDGPGS